MQPEEQPITRPATPSIAQPSNPQSGDNRIEIGRSLLLWSIQCDRP